MLHVRKMGEGHDPVILVHGFMGAGRNTQLLAQRWGAKDPSLRFLLPDLTGHGHSPPLPPGADLFTLARDLLATARAEGITGPARFVGHSLGGRVALAARTLEPAMVGEVVLIDISPGRIPSDRGDTKEVLGMYREAPSRAASRAEMREYFTSRGLSSALTEWLLTNLVHKGEVYEWRVDREALWALHEKVNEVDLWDALGDGCEVSLIRGGASPFVADSDVDRLRGLGCRVATLEGGDHYIHVNRTDEVVGLLTSDEGWD